VGTLREPKIGLELYQIQIAFSSVKDLVVNPLKKILKIMIPMHFGFNISIYLTHYKEDMYLMHIGTNIVIFRHNYIIDQLQFPSDKGKRFISYLSKNKFSYNTKSAYNIYSL
jgi:hypothetical protein